VDQPSHNVTTTEPPLGRARRTLPAIIERADVEGIGVAGFVRFWKRQRQQIDDLLHDHGAVLFSGLEIADVGAFQQMVSELGLNSMRYVDGNSPRTAISDGVYTSTEYPAEYFISLHNELSYSARWPARLFFCCLQTAEQGGETPLVDSRELLRALPNDLTAEFEARKIRYIRNLHGGNGLGPSWQKAFETIEPVDVERFASESGMHVEWRGSNVRLWSVRPATALHPLTREVVWFNQADQFHPSTHPEKIYKTMLALYKERDDVLPQNATYGDGAPIPLEHLETIRSVTRKCMHLFPWRRGDLLMVDNMLVAHGRMPFSGPRKIVVAMTSQ